MDNMAALSYLFKVGEGKEPAISHYEVFYIEMDGAPVFPYCPKACCKLSFSDFLPSTVSQYGVHVNH